MPNLSYAVVRAGAEWRILTAKRLLGHYETEDRALAVGLKLAREASEAGHDVELLVENPAGLLVPQPRPYGVSSPENRSFL